MTVLAATDLSDNSRSALRAAARLADRRELPLAVLYCDEGFADDAAWRMFVETPWEEPETRRREAREQLESFIDDTLTDEPEDLAIRPVVALDHLEDAIDEMIEEYGVELVVVGATGASALAETVLGSTAEDVVRSASVPVLVVPNATDLEPVDEILAPVDLSPPSRVSFELAVDLARQYAAALHVLRAIDVPTTSIVPDGTEAPPIDMQAYEDQMAESLEEFLADVDTDGIEVSTSLPLDPPTPAIVRTAEDRGSDLVVMGTHGRRGLGRLLLGSTTNKVLRRIPSPVLTIRPET